MHWWALLPLNEIWRALDDRQSLWRKDWLWRKRTKDWSIRLRCWLLRKMRKKPARMNVHSFSNAADCYYCPFFTVEHITHPTHNPYHPFYLSISLINSAIFHPEHCLFNPITFRPFVVFSHRYVPENLLYSYQPTFCVCVCIYMPKSCIVLI